MADNVKNFSPPKERTSEEPSRELQPQERRELERQASRFLKRLRLPGRTLEEIQRLKNYILYKCKKTEGSNVFAITSARSKEGVSFVSFHTAVSLARGLENSVLLVDGNFRDPALHEKFDNPNTTGFSDILNGTCETHQAIRPTYMPYLAFLPSGTPVADPGQLFRSEGFQAVLRKFKNRFDYVIFDTPPIPHFSDCLVLGPKVDHIILVVRAHKTKAQVAEHAKEQITKHGGKLLGVVLNRRRFFIPGFLYRHL